MANFLKVIGNTIISNTLERNNLSDDTSAYYIYSHDKNILYKKNNKKLQLQLSYNILRNANDFINAARQNIFDFINLLSNMDNCCYDLDYLNFVNYDKIIIEFTEKTIIQKNDEKIHFLDILSQLYEYKFNKDIILSNVTLEFLQRFYYLCNNNTKINIKITFKYDNYVILFDKLTNVKRFNNLIGTNIYEYKDILNEKSSISFEETKIILFNNIFELLHENNIKINKLKHNCSYIYPCDEKNEIVVSNPKTITSIIHKKNNINLYYHILAFIENIYTINVNNNIIDNDNTDNNTNNTDIDDINENFKDFKYYTKNYMSNNEYDMFKICFSNCNSNKCDNYCNHKCYFYEYDEYILESLNNCFSNKKIKNIKKYPFVCLKVCCYYDEIDIDSSFIKFSDNLPIGLLIDKSTNVKNINIIDECIRYYKINDSILFNDIINIQFNKLFDRPNKNKILIKYSKLIKYFIYFKLNCSKNPHLILIIISLLNIKININLIIL